MLVTFHISGYLGDSNKSFVYIFLIFEWYEFPFVLQSWNEAMAKTNTVPTNHYYKNVQTKSYM